MKIASGKFRDIPRTPAETLAFWVEYVVRHKGPPHSNVVGRHLSFYEYLLLDIIAILFASLLIVYIIFRKLKMKLLRRIKRRDKTD